MGNLKSNSSMNDKIKQYHRDGFISPVNVLTSKVAKLHRSRLEEAEKKIGTLHYKSKVHTVLTSPYEISKNKKILDIVEKIIGPNILLYNVTYVIKEPKTYTHVSWHQDLTYWGFSHDDQVSVWLALSEANDLSGAMKMIPGSHKSGRIEHQTTDDPSNVLLQGQTVQNVKEENAVLCSLLPGQASFHHGWTLHTSKSNDSNDRRIGLNIQYIATHVRQTKNDEDTAICIKGSDKYSNFIKEIPATLDLDSKALLRFKVLDEQYKKTAGS